MWYQVQNLLAKAAWIILKSVPLQTPGMSQVFPRDHEKLCLPLFPLQSPETLSKFVSINKFLGDLQAQFPCARNDDRPISSSTHHNLETVLQRSV